VKNYYSTLNVSGTCLECVWNLTEGNKDSRIDRAIELTEQFFEKMQVPTRLSHVDLGAADIDLWIEKLTQHGMVK
jgi:NADP-dependent alcohol dehydrogenase